LRAERSLRRGVRFRRRRDRSEYHTRNRPTQSRLSGRRTFEGGDSAFQGAERRDVSAPMSILAPGLSSDAMANSADRVERSPRAGTTTLPLGVTGPETRGESIGQCPSGARHVRQGRRVYPAAPSR
jgi:hypothetical protein